MLRVAVSVAVATTVGICSAAAAMENSAVSVCNEGSLTRASSPEGLLGNMNPTSPEVVGVVNLASSKPGCYQLLSVVARVRLTRPLHDSVTLSIGVGPSPAIRLEVLPTASGGQVNTSSMWTGYPSHELTIGTEVAVQAIDYINTPSWLSGRQQLSGSIDATADDQGAVELVGVSTMVVVDTTFEPEQLRFDHATSKFSVRTSKSVAMTFAGGVTSGRPISSVTYSIELTRRTGDGPTPAIQTAVASVRDGRFNIAIPFSGTRPGSYIGEISLAEWNQPSAHFVVVVGSTPWYAGAMFQWAAIGFGLCLIAAWAVAKRRSSRASA
jgi:hypothetical protein